MEVHGDAFWERVKEGQGRVILEEMMRRVVGGKKIPSTSYIWEIEDKLIRIRYSANDKAKRKDPDQIEKNEEKYQFDIITEKIFTNKPIFTLETKENNTLIEIDTSSLAGEETKLEGNKLLGTLFEKFIMEIRRWLGMIPMEKQLTNLIGEGNKQIIFTGAPGTGKTYTARKYVEENGKKQHEGYEFVQFHSSYDYTDFVEGLRPVRIKDKKDNENTTFVRMDGVFKEFCRKIVEKKLENLYKKLSGKNNEKILPNQKKVLLEYYYMEEMLSEKLIAKSGIKGKIKEFLESKSEDESKCHEIIKDIKNYIEEKRAEKREEKLEDLYKKLSDKINEKILPNQKKVLLEYYEMEEVLSEERIAKSGINGKIKEFLESKSEDESKCHEIIKDIKNFIEEEIEENSYFFIIDEINRADLSKVFGELMFGLEESYRGITNRFPTQYKNLKTYEINQETGLAESMKFDCFEEGFFVPKNLIIIGTMNDIDRSVEAFDFALRRRFRWVEVDANTELQEYISKSNKNLEAIKKQIINLNKYIAEKDGGGKFNLNKSYQIGHAYFMGYNRDDNGDNIDTIWKNRVEPILKEYCRGRDAGEFIEECRKKLITEQEKPVPEPATSDSLKS